MSPDPSFHRSSLAIVSSYASQCLAKRASSRCLGKDINRVEPAKPFRPGSLHRRRCKMAEAVLGTAMMGRHKIFLVLEDHFALEHRIEHFGPADPL